MEHPVLGTLRYVKCYLQTNIVVFSLIQGAVYTISLTSIVYYLGFIKCNLFPVYDFIFVQLVAGPLFIITWRGTWQNADTLFDEILFNGNITHSSIVALILGIFVSAVLIFYQFEIKASVIHNRNRYKYLRLPQTVFLISIVY